NWLNELYMAIQKQLVLVLTYQSFKAKRANDIVFHPYLLKEFNNRWFLVGYKNKRKKLGTLALDRIIKIDYDFTIPYHLVDFNTEQYYKNVIGITVNEGEPPQQITLWIDKSNAPYVITKPLHSSQVLKEQLADGSIYITITVQFNYELERLILGFGEAIKVISPNRFRNRIAKKIETANSYYQKTLGKDS
ncbi:helix-turn-helix transcriptional regulator, partial [Neptunitalea chrysea]|uniref:helix-turn-helix transcriptional regulator n=1 Tax=Neptunitalea chrysea TaxID=1647581 RepID=UPI0024922560